MKRTLDEALLITMFGGWFGAEFYYVSKLKWGLLCTIFWWTGIPTLISLYMFFYWLYIGKHKFDLKYNS